MKQEKEKILEDCFLFFEKKKKEREEDIFLERYLKYPNNQEALNDSIPREAELRGFQTENRLLKKENGVLRGQLQSLEEEMKDLMEKNSIEKYNTLKNKVVVLKKEIRLTSEKNKKYKSEVKDLKTQVYYLQQDKRALEKQIELGKVLLLKNEINKNEKKN